MENIEHTAFVSKLCTIFTFKHRIYEIAQVFQKVFR